MDFIMRSLGIIPKVSTVTRLSTLLLVVILGQPRECFTEGAGGLYSSNTVKGFLGSRVVIQCTYNRTEDWVFVRWKGKIGDNKFSILVTMIQNSVEPGFSDLLPPSLRRRLSSGVRYDSSLVVFYLEIHDVQCSDAGRYYCDVSTFSTEITKGVDLSLQAYPDKPNIAYDVLVIEVGQTFSLQCEGNVGYPPGVLQWYIRSSRHDYFQLLDTQSKTSDKINNINSNHDVLPEDIQCSNNFHAEAFLNITVHKNLDGASIRCAVKSAFTSPANSKYYDEVTIKLPEFPSTPTTVRRWNPRYSIFGGNEFPRGTDLKNTAQRFQLRTFYMIVSLLVVYREYANI